MAEVEVRGNGSLVDSHNSPIEMFAKWMYQVSRGGKVISKSQIAREIARIKQSNITENQVTSWISKSRVYLEEHLFCTLMNVPGEGWRITKENSGEVEVYFCKSIKKTIAWAERTMRLRAISKKQHMRSALREVFYDAEGNIKKLSEKKQKVFEIWAKVMEKENDSNEVKRIAN